MNIGLSLNKIKELTGGGGNGNVTTWELVGTGVGATPIIIPSDFEEISICSVYLNGSQKRTYTAEVTKAQLEHLIETSTYITDCQLTNYQANWSFSNNTVKLVNFTYNNNTVEAVNTQLITTYVYVIRKVDNVINLGTESNWALWGSVTGNTSITLPSEWEELYIKVECLKNSTDMGTYTANIYRGSVTNSLVSYRIGTTHENSNYGPYDAIKYDVSSKSINLSLVRFNNDVITNYSKLTVYYKKKADNVLDINDMGEWKEIYNLTAGSTSSRNIDISNIFDYEEVLITATMTGSTPNLMYSSIYKTTELQNTCAISMGSIVYNNINYSGSLYRSSQNEVDGVYIWGGTNNTTGTCKIYAR